MIDSLNVDSIDVIELIDAFGSAVELRRDRSSTDEMGFFNATKLMLRRMPRVIEPVRMSFGFLAELKVDDGAAISESVEIIEMLSKLSRFRLFVESKSHAISVPSSSSTMLCSKPSPAAALLLAGPMIGDSLTPVSGLSATKSLSSSCRTMPSK